MSTVRSTRCGVEEHGNGTGGWGTRRTRLSTAVSETAGRVGLEIANSVANYGNDVASSDDKQAGDGREDIRRTVA